MNSADKNLFGKVNIKQIFVIYSLTSNFPWWQGRARENVPLTLPCRLVKASLTIQFSLLVLTRIVVTDIYHPAPCQENKTNHIISQVVRLQIFLHLIFFIRDVFYFIFCVLYFFKVTESCFFGQQLILFAWTRFFSSSVYLQKYMCPNLITSNHI